MCSQINLSRAYTLSQPDLERVIVTCFQLRKSFYIITTFENFFLLSLNENYRLGSPFISLIDLTSYRHIIIETALTCLVKQLWSLIEHTSIKWCGQNTGLPNFFKLLRCSLHIIDFFLDNYRCCVILFRKLNHCLFQSLNLTR